MLSHLRAYEPNIDIQMESCICRLCRDDINNILDENFIPIGGENMGKRNHVVYQIAVIFFLEYHKYNWYKLCKLLNIIEEFEDCCAFPLCTEHYTGN